MRIEVFNREQIELALPDEPHIRIVIHDPDLPRPQIKNSTNCQEALYLAFDDTAYENEFDLTYSQDQADQVARLIKKWKKKLGLVLVSCEAGRSRSRGLAAALDEHFNGGGESLYFYDFAYEPNRLVYRKTKQALSKNELIARGITL